MKNTKIFVIVMMLMLSGSFFWTSSTDNMIVSAGDVYNSAASPANATTHYRNGNLTLSVTLVTKTGATMNQNFTTNVSGTWTTIGQNLHGANATVTDTLSGFTSANKKYFWASNVSNSNATHEWDNNTYYFYTMSSDEPPTTSGGSSDTANRVTIFIRDSNGDPVHGVRVQVDKRSRVTNNNGAVVFTLDSGSYKVYALHDDYNFNTELINTDDSSTFTITTTSKATLSVGEDDGIALPGFELFIFAFAAICVFIIYRRRVI